VLCVGAFKSIYARFGIFSGPAIAKHGKDDGGGDGDGGVKMCRGFGWKIVKGR